MWNSRFFSLLGITLAVVFTLSLAPCASAQVTVNAPQGLLGGKDKAKTGNKENKAPNSGKKEGAAQAAQGGEGGDGEAQPGEAQPQEHHAAAPARAANRQNAPQQQKSKIITSSEAKESFHYTNQGVSKQLTGFRIQVLFSSRQGARNLAYARAKEIANAFPQYHYYVSYNAPQWRLRVGDFTKRESARKALSRFKKAFKKYASEAIIVTDNINVWGGAPAAPKPF